MCDGRDEYSGMTALRSSGKTRRKPPTVTLAAHRDSIGITQQGVAERVHALGYPNLLDRSAIACYEDGSRPIPDALLPYLAAVLNLKLTDITLDPQAPAMAAAIGA